MRQTALRATEQQSQLSNLLPHEEAILEWMKAGPPREEPTAISMPPINLLSMTKPDGDRYLSGPDCLENIYGARGVPTNHSPILDHLGRVIRKKDQQGEYPMMLPPKHRVTLMRDHLYEYSCLTLEIFVEGSDAEEAQFAAIFARAGCKRAKSVLEADLVIFTGGTDVDPMLYHEERMVETDRPDTERDLREMNLYLLCKEHGIPMLGICRGAQFLHVMHGGKLWQDIDGHQGAHSMNDLKTKEHIDRVSSVHHQSCRPNTANGMQIIATAAKSQTRWANASTKDTGSRVDIEAFFYPDTCSIGIQGHPEYSGYPRFTQWCMKLIEDCVILNTDIEWKGKNRRIRDDVMTMREERERKEASIICLPALPPPIATTEPPKRGRGRPKKEPVLSQEDIELERAEMPKQEAS